MSSVHEQQFVYNIEHICCCSRHELHGMFLENVAHMRAKVNKNSIIKYRNVFVPITMDSCSKCNSALLLAAVIFQ